MTNKFLSNWFNKMASADGVGERLRYNNVLGQLKGDPKQLNAFRTAYAGLDKGLDSTGASALLKQFGATDMGQAGIDNLTADPWNNGNAGTLLKGYAGAHPMKTAAGVGLGLANISGLMDNDYWGGQALGALAGGLGSRYIGKSFSPMLTMAGGAVGSLFDKLREKQKSANQQQYYRQ